MFFLSHRRKLSTLKCSDTKDVIKTIKRAGKTYMKPSDKPGGSDKWHNGCWPTGLLIRRPSWFPSLWHPAHTHARSDVFSGSLINFTVVCRVPSEGVSWRGRDSIGRPLPHPRFGCLIGPPAASSQMNGTLLTPNLCRPWSVPHLGGTCATGCGGEEGGGEHPLVFFLSSWRLMEAEAWAAWGNRRQNVWFDFVLASHHPFTFQLLWPCLCFVQAPFLYFFVLLNISTLVFFARLIMKKNDSKKEKRKTTNIFWSVRSNLL